MRVVGPADAAHQGRLDSERTPPPLAPPAEPPSDGRVPQKEKQKPVTVKVEPQAGPKPGEIFFFVSAVWILLDPFGSFWFTSTCEFGLNMPQPLSLSFIFSFFPSRSHALKPPIFHPWGRGLDRRIFWGRGLDLVENMLPGVALKKKDQAKVSVKGEGPEVPNQGRVDPEFRACSFSSTKSKDVNGK